LDHSIVFAETGRFIAWPANNGIWRFANGDLLVGHSAGAYVEKKGHNGSEPYRHQLSRSVDGGRTWTTESPTPFVDGTLQHAAPETIDFTDPRLALRMIGNGYPTDNDVHYPDGGFVVSRDEGRTWSGVHAMGNLPAHPEFAGRHSSARTNYLIDGNTCLMFASTRIAADNKPTLWASEKVACVRTDNGRDFEFLGWVVPTSDPYRATMPSGVRVTDGSLFVAARRRHLAADAAPGANTDQCWIDGYVSRDGGTTWVPAGKIADTGKWNGNPPALALTADGRIACVYGNRDRATIEAVISSDMGATWSAPTVLREDYHRDSFGDPDLGYCRLTLNSEGELVAAYYWATETHPHHHIAATRWRP
jgi:hypothetical protein